MRLVAPLLSLLLGCQPPDAEQYLTWQLAGEGYEVAPRARNTLVDLEQVSGLLGSVLQGGQVLLEDSGDMLYEGGRALHVDFDAQRGVAVPLDEHGLVLWSFYGHLEDLHAELPEHGFDPQEFFPIDAAWTPVIPDLFLEMLPKENAAYATAGHFFILLDDLVAKDVPLAANAGIVRHEFGHALFHWLTTGDVLASAPFDMLSQTEGSLYYSSLHEGFADSFAALTLDEPDFFDGSFDLPERDLSGDHRVEGVEQLPEQFLLSADEELLAIYDPYPLGTVFAATAWDHRLAIDDPDEALAILVDGVSLWSSRGDHGDGWGLLDAWVQSAPAGSPRDALCSAVVLRFGAEVSVDGCEGRR